MVCGGMSYTSHSGVDVELCFVEVVWCDLPLNVIYLPQTKVVHPTSRSGAHPSGGAAIGGGLERLKSKERDCLTDEAGIFELRIITPEGGIEASCMGTHTCLTISGEPDVTQELVHFDSE
ncbi:hypothetical protein Taro_020906 [Colocasia esculenta]|uniref:Uncharacterized protein n=1 Tax=Colocasia esculenta TaxID=4460 RepID=A0A843V9V6_COLES|nr:hypothetical protein [Colocasia esculenta]